MIIRVEFEVEVEGPVAGRFSGPPENCYEGQGGWAGILETKLDGDTVGTHSIRGLSTKETEQLEALIYKIWEVKQNDV